VFRDFRRFETGGYSPRIRVPGQAGMVTGKSRPKGITNGANAPNHTNNQVVIREIRLIGGIRDE
jgi:hypothetical protein